MCAGMPVTSARRRLTFGLPRKARRRRLEGDAVGAAVGVVGRASWCRRRRRSSETSISDGTPSTAAITSRASVSRSRASRRNARWHGSSRCCRWRRRRRRRSAARLCHRMTHAAWRARWRCPDARWSRASRRCRFQIQRRRPGAGNARLDDDIQRVRAEREGLEAEERAFANFAPFSTSTACWPAGSTGSRPEVTAPRSVDTVPPSMSTHRLLQQRRQVCRDAGNLGDQVVHLRRGGVKRLARVDGTRSVRRLAS